MPGGTISSRRRLRRPGQSEGVGCSLRGDLDPIVVDGDPLERALDEIQIAGLWFRIALAKGRDHQGFDLGSGDAGDRACLFGSSLGQHAGDVVAIAHPVLDRVGGRHALAAIVEDAADQQRLGLLVGVATCREVGAELGLHGIEQLDWNDRLVLARMAQGAMVDLAQVGAVANNLDQRSVGERDPTHHPARGEGAGSGSHTARAGHAVGLAETQVRDSARRSTSRSSPQPRRPGACASRPGSRAAPRLPSGCLCAWRRRSCRGCARP